MPDTLRDVNESEGGRGSYSDALTHREILRRPRSRNVMRIVIACEIENIFGRYTPRPRPIRIMYFASVWTRCEQNVIRDYNIPERQSRDNVERMFMRLYVDVLHVGMRLVNKHDGVLFDCTRSRFLQEGRYYSQRFIKRSFVGSICKEFLWG